MRLFTLCLALSVAGKAEAGGYYYSDSGIVATGRGGAFVAGADNQFAQYFNPAGLIRVDRPTVNIGWSGVQQNVTFERQNADGGFYEPVENQAKPFNVPEIGFVTPLGEQFGFAFGFFSPFAPSSLYPEEGAQRYSVKDTTIIQFSVGPSLAWQPVKQFTIGAGVHWQYLGVGETLDISTGLSLGDEESAGDIAIGLGVKDAFNVNFNAGVLIEPIEPLSIGLSIQPGARFGAKGHADIDFSGNFIEDLGLNTSKYSDDDVVAEIGLPLVLRGGIAVRPVPKLEIEFATVYQRWSQVNDIQITDVKVPLDVESGSPLELFLPPEDQVVQQDFTIPQNFADTTSLRLGAEYRIMDELEWRAGGFYETSAVAPKDMDVALIDTPKVQIGTGPSVYLLDGDLKFDAAFAMLFFQDVEVRNSNRLQTDAGVIEGVEPQAVGNGNYSSNGWVLGIGANYAFGKGRQG